MKGVFKKDPFLVTCVSVVRKRIFSVHNFIYLEYWEWGIVVFLEKALISLIHNSERVRNITHEKSDTLLSC